MNASFCERQVDGSPGVNIAMTCNRCGGSGRLPGTPCGACSGAGRQRAEERVKDRIPAGIENGNTVRLPGKGDAGEAGAPAGDLYLVLDVEPHPEFRRAPSMCC